MIGKDSRPCHPGSSRTPSSVTGPVNLWSGIGSWDWAESADAATRNAAKLIFIGLYKGSKPQGE